MRNIQKKHTTNVDFGKKTRKTNGIHTLLYKERNVLLKSTLVSFWIALHPFPEVILFSQKAKKEKNKTKLKKDVLSIFSPIYASIHIKIMGFTDKSKQLNSNHRTGTVVKSIRSFIKVPVYSFT